MSNLVPYQGRTAGQVVRRANSAQLAVWATGELAQTKAVTSRQVGETASREVAYLRAIERMAQQTGDQVLARDIALIVDLTVGGITRTVADFNSEL